MVGGQYYQNSWGRRFRSIQEVARYIGLDPESQVRDGVPQVKAVASWPEEPPFQDLPLELINGIVVCRYFLPLLNLTRNLSAVFRNLASGLPFQCRYSVYYRRSAST